MNTELFKIMKRKNKADRQKGFTFIETLVSITILLFVVSGVLTMTTISIKANFNQINHTKAVKLAEEAVERKLREDFDTLAGETSGFGAISGFPTYSRTVTVNNVDVDNKTIIVSVTWKLRFNAGLQPITLTVGRTR